MPPTTIEQRVSRCCKEWMPGQTHWLEVKREMEAAVLEAYDEAELIVHNNGLARPSKIMALIRAARDKFFQKPSAREKFFSEPSADQASKLMVEGAEKIGQRIAEAVENVILAEPGPELDAAQKALWPGAGSAGDRVADAVDDMIMNKTQEEIDSIIASHSVNERGWPGFVVNEAYSEKPMAEEAAERVSKKIQEESRDSSPKVEPSDVPKLFGGITAAQHKEIAESADKSARQMFFRESMKAFGEFVNNIKSPKLVMYDAVVERAKQRLREWADSQIAGVPLPIIQKPIEFGLAKVWADVSSRMQGFITDAIHLDKRYMEYMVVTDTINAKLGLPIPMFNEYWEFFKYEGGSRYYAAPFIGTVIPICECKIFCGAGIDLPKTSNASSSD